MYAFHASYSFASEWVLYLDVGLTILGLAWLARTRPRGLVATWSRAVWKALRRASARPGRLCLALGAAVVGLNGLYCAVAGFPIPGISDELGHLLTADTFAHGRWVNEPPPSPEHFEAVHVILDPVYTSKYPPGIGSLLGLGQAVGRHPGVGVWLGSGLLAAAALWGLAAFLPPPWPLVGALFVTLRLGLGSYWGHSYWGGALAAAAAFLLFGSVQRLTRQPALGSAVGLAVSLVVLANSRPWEGLAVALVAAVPILGRLYRTRRGDWPRTVTHFLLPFIVLLVGLGGSIPYYNYRVTGDPLVFPDWHYRAANDLESVFTFVASREAAESRAAQPELGAFDPRRVVPAWAVALGRTAYFQLGLPLLLAFLGLVGTRRKPWMGWVAASFLVCGLFLVFDAWGVIPHYTAPALPAAVLLALAGLRSLSAAPRWRRGRALPLGVLAVALGLCLWQLPAWRPDPWDWTRRRHDLVAELTARGGQHLLIVPDEFRRADAWVYNPADWETAPVLMAGDLGEAAAGRLLAAFPGRRAWRLVPEPRISWPTAVPWAPPGGHEVSAEP